MQNKPTSNNKADKAVENPPVESTEQQTETTTEAKNKRATAKLPLSFQDDKLELVKGEQRLILTKVKTEWGKEDKHWSYPSVAIVEDLEANKIQREALEEFLGEKESCLLLLEAFDNVCQRTWKETQDAEKFRIAMTSDMKRTPKKMSVFYDNLRKEKVKEIVALKASTEFKDGKPESKTLLEKLMAERNELLKKYQEAMLAEVDAAMNEEV